MTIKKVLENLVNSVQQYDKDSEIGEAGNLEEAVSHSFFLIGQILEEKGISKQIIETL